MAQVVIAISALGVVVITIGGNASQIARRRIDRVAVCVAGQQVQTVRIPFSQSDLQ